MQELMSSWDDAKARALFEPTFFRYQTIEALREKFTTLAGVHGRCQLDGQPTFINRLRGSFSVKCERGAIQFAAGLAPGPKPRLQALELREDLPPSADLEHAGAAMIKLLERWDTTAATQWLANSAEVPKLERAFAILAVVHGPCSMDRVAESDGKKRATFLLSCRHLPLELTVVLEPSGKIAQASGRRPRSDTKPNCAD